MTQIHTGDIVNLVHEKEMIRKWQMWNCLKRK
nr:MAG TPA: hypothetical protein [Caudoviricetes sp.]